MKWFKPAARLRSNNAFWDPKEECIRNKSDKMLTAALSNANSLYWEAEVQEPVTPKQKKIKVDDELVTDSILMVKMAISSIKTHQHNPSTNKGSESGVTKKMSTPTDDKTVSSQTSMITQLMEQVSILQLAHNEINSKLDKLTVFIMAQSASTTTPTQSKQKAARSQGSPGHKT